MCLSLTACDKACSGCTGAGPDKCQACASGYQDTEGTCTGTMYMINCLKGFTSLCCTSIQEELLSWTRMESRNQLLNIYKYQGSTALEQKNYTAMFWCNLQALCFFSLPSVFVFYHGWGSAPPPHAHTPTPKVISKSSSL